MALSEREIEIIIRARDEAQRVLQQTGAALSDLDRSARSASSGMEQASRSMQQASGSSDRATGGIRGLMGGFSGIISKAGLVGFGIQQISNAATGMASALLGPSAALEQTKIGLESLLGSGEAAQKMLTDIQNVAARTPFEFPELTATVQRLLAFGFEAESVLPTLTNIGDAVAAMGGSSEQVDRVATALGQMAAKGKVSAEEMMQLTEVGIPAWELLAGKMGMTTGELQDLVSKGAVPAGQAINDLSSAMGERFGGAMEAQSRTMTGMLSTLRDTAQMALTQVMQPAFEVAEKGLKAVVDLLSSDAFQGGITAISNGIGGAMDAIGRFADLIRNGLGGALNDPTVSGGLSALQTAAEGVATLFRDQVGPQLTAIADTVRTFITDTVVPGLGRIKEAFQPFIDTLWPFIRDTVIPGLQSLGQQVTAAFQPIAEEVGQVFAVLNETLGPTLQALWTMVETVFTTIGTFLSDHSTEITRVLTDAWNLISTVVSTAISLVRDTIVIILNLIQGDWKGAWEAVKQLGEDLWNGIKDAIVGIVTLLKDTLGPIWDAISSKAQEVWNGIKDFLGEIGGKILDAIVWPFETARSGVITALNAVGSFAADAANGILRSFEALQHGVVRVLNAITDAVGLGSPFSEWTAPTITFTPIGQTAAATGAAVRAMAAGGVIDEPVVGLGLRSGERYLFSEGGRPEAVVPLTGAGSSRAVTEIAGDLRAPSSDIAAALASGRFGVGGIGDDILAGIKDIAGSVAGAVRDWISRGAEALVSWALDKVGGLSLDLPPAFGDTAKALTKVTGWLTDWARSLLNKLDERLTAQESAAVGPLSSGAVSPGGWINPVPGGWFTQGSYGSFSHGTIPAVDISAAYGAPIVAPKAGTVIFLGQNGWSGGTGRTGMVDHGGQWVTLYGHVSRFAPVGTTAAQGAWIGAVGDPVIDGGYGSGAHLHFEVFHNGTRVRPEDIIPLAAGGTTRSRSLALVGERGPELAILPAGTTVVPAELTARLLGSVQAFADGGTVGAAMDQARAVLAEAAGLPGLSEEDAGALKRAADAYRAALDALQAAVELVRGLQDTLGGIDSGQVTDQITSVKFLLEHVALSLGDTAAMIRAERSETYLDDLKAFAESVAPALKVLTDALQTIAALTDEAAPATNDPGLPDRITALKFLVEHIAVSLGDTAALIRAERPEAFVDDLRAFGDAIGPALRAVTDAVGMAAALTEAAPFGDGDALRDRVTALKFLVEHVVLSLGDTAALIRAERPDAFLDDLKAFSDVVGPAVGAIRGVLDVVDRLTADIDQEAMTKRIGVLADLVRELAVELAQATAEALAASGSLTDDLDRFTAVIAPALGAIDEATGAFAALAGMSALPARTSRLFAANLAVAADALRRGIDELTGLKEDGTLSAFSAIITELADAFGRAFEVFGTGGPASTARPGSTPGSTISGGGVGSGVGAGVGPSQPAAGQATGAVGPRPQVDVTVQIGPEVVARQLVGPVARRVRWTGGVA